MNYIKKLLPRKIRKFIHLIIFNKATCFIENLILFNKLEFDNEKITDNQKIISNFTRSLIRHNLYEKYEIEAMKKLNFFDNNYIDLGSSIGLTSLLVSKRVKNKKVILVEPVSEFLDFSKKLLLKYYENEYHFINAALTYNSNKKFIIKNNNLDSYISEEGDIEVNPIKFSEILKVTKLDSFNLLIDTEGGAYDLLFNDQSLLKNCKKLIIEEKFTTFYSEKKVFDKLKALGFQVVYFQKSWESNIIGAIK